MRLCALRGREEGPDPGETADVRPLGATATKPGKAAQRCAPALLALERALAAAAAAAAATPQPPQPPQATQATQAPQPPQGAEGSATTRAMTTKDPAPGNGLPSRYCPCLSPGEPYPD